jgi:hypothetical protein
MAVHLRVMRALGMCGNHHENRPRFSLGTGIWSSLDGSELPSTISLHLDRVISVAQPLQEGHRRCHLPLADCLELL